MKDCAGRAAIEAAPRTVVEVVSGDFHDEDEVRWNGVRTLLGKGVF